MKVFRHTNFMRLIYATLLALPFVAILSRVIYVQSNKNAYQSYEGNINENHYEEINNGLPKYDLYFSFNGQLQINEMTTNSNTFFIDSLEFVNDNLPNNLKETITNANYFRLWYDGRPFITFENLTTNLSSYVYNFTIKVNLNAINLANQTNQINTIFYRIYDINSLDNVFEYSVNKFIENNNFGKINLFQWTTNLFFDSNDVNNMYVGFINWYLNYTLLVSATYILFLVLMWFINFARRLLERGMNYDW